MALVETQRVIDRINKQREGLNPDIFPQDKIGDSAYKICIEFIERMPEEIVRCKDCKKRMPEGYCTVHVQNIHGLATAWYMPDDEDFCSKAERRTDG